MGKGGSDRRAPRRRTTGVTSNKTHGKGPDATGEGPPERRYPPGDQEKHPRRGYDTRTPQRRYRRDGLKRSG